MLEDLKLSDTYDGFLFLAEAARNPPLLRSHHHIELEVNLVVRGTITYVVNGKRFTFPQRSLIWMFPAQEHQLVDRSDDAQYFVAVFKPGLIADTCRSPEYQDLKRESVETEGLLDSVLDPGPFDLIRQLMESMMEGSLDADILNREAGFGVKSDFSFRHRDPDALNAGLRHLLLASWRSYRAGQATINTSVPLHPAVRKALQVLSSGEGSQDIKNLLSHCGVSESYLSRIFHRQIGVPLVRYRNSIRLGKFWDCYRQPEQKTILECVYAAGFGSYAQFYKVFCQAYGQGPRECLKRGNSDLLPDRQKAENLRPSKA
ncbi:MAG: AraC family transcriptional regulator [Chthoniobacterales bacterium]